MLAKKIHLLTILPVFPQPRIGKETQKALILPAPKKGYAYQEISAKIPRPAQPTRLQELMPDKGLLLKETLSLCSKFIRQDLSLIQVPSISGVYFWKTRKL